MDQINLPSLRNPEFYQFISDVLGIVKANGPAALKVPEQHQELTRIFKDMTTLFKIKKGFITTEELEALDARRDRAITGLAALMHAYSYHYDDTTRANADTLSDNLKLYGNGGIARENYVSETAIISNLVNDWKTKPALKEAVAALKLEGWLTELDDGNKAFNAAFLLRNSEKGAASPEKLREKRIEAVKAWYELRDHIAAHALLKKRAEPFGKTVKELEALVSQFAQLIKNRKGKNGSEQIEDVEAPDEPVL